MALPGAISRTPQPDHAGVPPSGSVGGHNFSQKSSGSMPGKGLASLPGHALAGATSERYTWAGPFAMIEASGCTAHWSGDGLVRLLPPLHAAQRGTPREIAAASKMIVGTSALALPLLLRASIAIPRAE
jgi:hypothetical protein